MTFPAEHDSTGISWRTSLLKRLAHEEGFDRVGIARLTPSEHGEQFLSWLERGDHGGMGYLARRTELRCDSARLLEGARSALCVAMHYPGAAPEENDLWRGVARYARGEDYHGFMLEKLRRVGERVEEAFPGSRTRSYVDTGPLLERELAARAGLGSVGKNTMLLHPTGSWFLLGELLLTLELEPDEPLADLCGRCTRCLEACPTGALYEPYRLDSRRCLSYRTIEHRGEWPEHWQGESSGWVFGCDVCQDVCPWNSQRNPRRSDVVAEHWHLADERAALGLGDVLRLDRERYVEVFRGSAMKRSKLEGLQRNAIAVLADRVLASPNEGAGGGPEHDAGADVAAIVASLDNDTVLVRRTALQALSRIARREPWREFVVAALRTHLQREDEPAMRSRMLSLLASLGTPPDPSSG